MKKNFTAGLAKKEMAYLSKNAHDENDCLLKRVDLCLCLTMLVNEAHQFSHLWTINSVRTYPIPVKKVKSSHVFTQCIHINLGFYTRFSDTAHFFIFPVVFFSPKMPSLYTCR